MIDRKGRDIPDDMRIRELKIVGCKMNGFHREVYENLIEAKDDYGNFDRNAQMIKEFDSFGKSSLLPRNY